MLNLFPLSLWREKTHLFQREILQGDTEDFKPLDIFIQNYPASHLVRYLGDQGEEVLDPPREHLWTGSRLAGLDGPTPFEVENVDRIRLHTFPEDIPPQLGNRIAGIFSV